MPARSALPFTLAVNVPAIGVIGYLAGPKVYLFDTFSLANPIGSHTVIVRPRPSRPREVDRAGLDGGPVRHPGHLGPAARRTRPGAGVGGPGRPGLRPARLLPPAITAPLTVSRALSNVGDSFRFTTLSFSADPLVAERQLCGTAARLS